MNEEVPIEQLERFPLGSLTPDEISVVNGLAYSSLPANFEISQQVIDACIKVGAAKPKGGVSAKEAYRRVQELFEKKVKGPHTKSDELHLASAKENFTALEREFIQNFYLVGTEVVVGRIHEGQGWAVQFGGEKDGLPDKDRIVIIHKHPNDLGPSLGDVVRALADEPDTPVKCLYFSVGPNIIHLLVSTIDTIRIDPEPLLKTTDYASVLGVTETTDDTETKEAAGKYRLGYYSSPKSTSFLRLK